MQFPPLKNPPTPFSIILSPMVITILTIVSPHGCQSPCKVVDKPLYISVYINMTTLCAVKKLEEDTNTVELNPCLTMLHTAWCRMNTFEAQQRCNKYIFCLVATYISNRKSQKTPYVTECRIDIVLTLSGIPNIVLTLSCIPNELYIHAVTL